MTAHSRRTGPWRRRVLNVAALTVITVIVAAPAAAAHVAVDSAAPNGDGTTTITLTWNHSCSPDAPTTGVDVTAADGVTFTGASTGIPGWTSTVEPGSATFAGPGVPTGQQVSIAVVARITGTPGSTIMFPAIQHCGDQQTGWTDPDSSAEHPAPSLIATAAVLAPVATAIEPTAGADITQTLTGIVLLAGVLGTIGYVANRATRRGAS